MRLAKLTAGLVALTFLSACILSESRHTLYLQPNGALDWVILQTDIRASDPDADKREREEGRYLDAARESAHPAAAGLHELGARSVHTRILRDERPYAIETTARFRAADDLFETFFEKLGVDCEARFLREGGLRRLTIRLSGIRPDEVDPPAEDDPAFDLVDEDWRIALTAGRFVDVQGFVKTDDDDAVLLSWETFEGLVQPDGTLTLALAWTVED